MGKRRRARELVLQVLFHMEFNSGDVEEGFRLICENFAPKGKAEPFSRELARGIWEKKGRLDELIALSSRNWRLERMSRVDRNILRMAVFEIRYMQDIPAKVSIDEAVELGKRYGTPDSAAFINGILDNIYNHLMKEQVVD